MFNHDQVIQMIYGVSTALVFIGFVVSERRLFAAKPVGIMTHILVFLMVCYTMAVPGLGLSEGAVAGIQGQNTFLLSLYAMAGVIGWGFVR